MANNNLTVKKGLCINYGNCMNADTKKLIEVNLGDDFSCPDCDGMLIEVRPKKFPYWIIKVILGVLGLIGAGVVTYNIFSNNDIKIDIVKENLTLTINNNQPIPENIANIIAKKNIEWNSSNPNVATIDNNNFIAKSEGETIIIATTIEKKDTLVICYVTIEPNTTTEPIVELPTNEITQPANIPVKKESSSVTLSSDISLISALIKIADEKVDELSRIQLVEPALNNYFSSENAAVEVYSSNGKTMLKRENVRDFLERVSTSFNLVNFTIMPESQTDENKKYTFLKIQEIYK